MHLSLSLLGAFQAALDGRPVTEFYSGKVRALLAYLAIEAGRPHTRAMLACLLWPDWADRAALGNLRFALAKLRQALGDQEAVPPFLLITRETIQLNPAADFRVDVQILEQELAASQWQTVDADGQSEPDVRRAIGHLEAAVRQYQGRFLEGFSVGDSTAFEDWARLKREQFEQEMRSALHGLAALHGRLEDQTAAESYARWLLQMDPWDDLANRRLMVALAEAGQRNAALRHYAAYREDVARELGAEPSGETTTLYEQIKRGARRPAPVAPAEAASPQQSPGALPLLARESQLAQFDACLSQALGGHGCVAFVSGEAGSGKTMLMAEFARRAMARQANLVAVFGRCNAYTGMGDPYLPFREILRLLTGGVAPAAAMGLAVEARRLQAASGQTARLLLEVAPDLVERLIPAQALTPALLQGGSDPTWQARLQDLTRPTARRGVEQVDLFSQMTALLVTLARTHPLVMLLDDLQWADNGSLSLLFHLGRSVTGASILIAGAYRPEDVAAGRAGARHPLQAVVNELRRVHGSAEIDLNRADGRRFVAAILDREPTGLAAGFGDTLFHHTGGHPLFTIELLRGLHDRGELSRDGAGAWVAANHLDWSRLPPRVEAIIDERFERLPAEAQDLLSAASVQGEEFTAEVAAAVLGLDRDHVLRQLSDLLGRQYRLVAGSGTAWLEGERQPLSRYRFRHFLFQNYLYGRLDPVQRARWHGLTGEALERLYGARQPDIALQLAWHFEQAGLVTRAVDHLLAAGSQAMRLAAYRQAADDFDRGLALLAALPATAARAEQELRLRLALAGPLSMLHGPGDPIRIDSVARAIPLSRQAGSGMQVIYALVAEAVACRDRCNFDRATELGAQVLALAQASQERRAALLAHFVLGSTATFSGNIIQARVELEAALGLYRAAEDRELALTLGADIQPPMLAWLGMALWTSGYPDQAAAHVRDGIGLAQELAQPYTFAVTLTSAVWLALLSRVGLDLPRAHIATLQRLTNENKIEAMRVWAGAYDGWLLTQQGRVAEGLAVMRRTLAAAGRAVGVPGLLVVMARICLDAGLYDEGLAALEDGLALLKTGIGRHGEPETYRLLGALTLGKGGPSMTGVAASWFLKALEVARDMDALSWELRAGVDLARLWRGQGQAAQAQALLAGIYGRFTEGFATPDMREAAALLDELRI